MTQLPGQFYNQTQARFPVPAGMPNQEISLPADERAEPKNTGRPELGVTGGRCMGPASSSPGIFEVPTVCQPPPAPVGPRNSPCHPQPNLTVRLNDRPNRPKTARERRP